MSSGRNVAAALVMLFATGACSSSHAVSASTPVSVGTTSTPRATRSAGCRALSSSAHGLTDHTIRSGGRVRTYQLDVPSDYDGTAPFALVLGLHALSQSYADVPGMVGFDRGGRDHFIGVAPSGLVSNGSPYWNAAPTANNDDLAFITALLDHLEATLCIDTTRVFATGMSNGAQLSSLLACRISNRISGVGAVAGEEYPRPCAGRPVPIIAFHGTADPVLPYGGGGLDSTKIATVYYYGGHPPRGLPAPLGIDESMRRWALHNHCAAHPLDTRVAPHVIRRSWPRCAAETVLYIVEGEGHQWPGKALAGFAKFGPTTTEIDASSLILRFFLGSRA